MKRTREGSPGISGTGAGEGVADGPVEHVHGLADGVREALEVVGAVGVGEERGGLPGRRGRRVAGGEAVQDGMGVGEHERDVAGDAGVDGGEGHLLVAAGVVDQRHGGVPFFSFAPGPALVAAWRRAAVARSR